MAYCKSRTARFEDDVETAKFNTGKENGAIKLKCQNDGIKSPRPKRRRVNKDHVETRGTVMSTVFSEDYERVTKRILDPRGPIIHCWNQIFLVACFISLFVDPLYFYLPTVQDEFCIDVNVPHELIITIVRSVVDIFYIIQIIIQFRTAYIAPSSRAFGRGELVINPSKIASRYLSKRFWIDLVAALPFPQVMILIVIPNLRASVVSDTKKIFRFSIISQYLLRLILIFPLSSQNFKATGVMTEKAWAGAAYNLMLFLLASHVLGSCWYLLAIGRQEACWKASCVNQGPQCHDRFFDCQKVRDHRRIYWLKSSNITQECDPSTNSYPFGIYGDALTNSVTSSPFLNKYFYCLWWGLRSLVCFGQTLMTTTFVGENCFSIGVGTLGLFLFSLLIGNMQAYLQSTTMRLEEWRIKRNDTEQWMHHRQLPHELRQSVRRYGQYKWVTTRGVDEEAILKDLPLDLRREVKRHLCLGLVRRVPFFEQMDEQMLDAICERLKPRLCTPGTCLVREGVPVNEMIFIVRGHLDSHTTNGGSSGFFNSCLVGPGDFCGEEVLTWALDPRSNVILPSSTRTVKAINEVEGFAIDAEDVRFVASRFRRLHSKELRHRFRFYSHQWRTWAARFIQAAWRRYRRRKGVAGVESGKGAMIISPEEPAFEQKGESVPPNSKGRGLDAWGSARRAASRKRVLDSASRGSLKKPAEPDFASQEY